MELQKRWNIPEIKVITAPYSICHSPPLTGSFNCEIVLKNKMSILLSLKGTFTVEPKNLYLSYFEFEVTSPALVGLNVFF